MIEDPFGGEIGIGAGGAKLSDTFILLMLRFACYVAYVCIGVLLILPQLNLQG